MTLSLEDSKSVAISDPIGGDILNLENEVDKLKNEINELERETIRTTQFQHNFRKSNTVLKHPKEWHSF